MLSKKEEKKTYMKLYESVSVLHKEADWYKRGMAEAIHIFRESPDLNRGRERHTLPKIYQELMPPPPAPAESRDQTSSSDHVTQSSNSC